MFFSFATPDMQAHDQIEGEQYQPREFWNQTANAIASNQVHGEGLESPIQRKRRLKYHFGYPHVNKFLKIP
jgi:hypothetical protein